MFRETASAAWQLGEGPDAGQLGLVARPRLGAGSAAGTGELRPCVLLARLRDAPAPCWREPYSRWPNWDRISPSPFESRPTSRPGCGRGCRRAVGFVPHEDLDRRLIRPQRWATRANVTSTSDVDQTTQIVHVRPVEAGHCHVVTDRSSRSTSDSHLSGIEADSSLAITSDTYSHLLEGVGQQAATAAAALAPRADRRTQNEPRSAPDRPGDTGESGIAAGQTGGPPGDRTQNPRIKSPLLCQLS